MQKKMVSYILIVAHLLNAFSAGANFGLAVSVSAADGVININATEVSAHSAVLINADTGTVLYGKFPSQERAIASTTKIMTAILTLESGEKNDDLDKPFTVDSEAIKAEGTTMGLREGDIVTKRALCYGMLLPSGNDAAGAAAVRIAGSMPSFVQSMNAKAAEIGMADTVFANPSGLDDFEVGIKGQHSTAYDMALLTRYALRNPQFRRICATQEMNLYFGNPPYRRTLRNNNRLLNRYEGCIGVKTGFTDNARRCLISAATRNGVTLIAVTLNAPDDWNDHTKMFDYGFSKAKEHTVDVDEKVAVAGLDGTYARVGLAEDLFLPMTDDEMKRVSLAVNKVPFVYPEYRKGDFAGTVQVLFDGKVICRTKLKIV